ncbi:MAG: GNAT family N-acetyltransferase [Pseudomonadota bacterium]
MNGTDALEVRPLVESDRAAWTQLWTAYLAFYETSLPVEVYDTAWWRLMGAEPYDANGLVACFGGKPVGLTHYLFHRHGWKVENVCYLQDLYADPAHRGTGIGRALIEAVYAAADAQGCPSVYWMTQEHNATARQLYDRIAVRSGFIQYKRGQS